MKKLVSILLTLALVASFAMAIPVAAADSSTFTVTDGTYTTVPHADPMASGDISATFTGSWDTAILGGFTASGMSGSYFPSAPPAPAPVWSTGTVIDVSGTMTATNIAFSGTVFRLSGDPIADGSITGITGPITITLTTITDGDLVATLTGVVNYDGTDYPINIAMDIGTLTVSPEDDNGTGDGVNVTADVVQPALTLDIVGNGTVYVAYGTPPGEPPMGWTESYTASTVLSAPKGTIIGLTAGWTDLNYIFESWTGNVEPYWMNFGPHAVQVVLDADKAATVTFVEKIISISVTPDNINFDTIMQGDSGSDSLDVANLGNVKESVTASLANEDPAGFYTDNLEMDSDLVANWGIVLPVSNSAPVGLTLNVPLDAAPGTKTGTIVFTVAEAA